MLLDADQSERGADCETRESAPLASHFAQFHSGDAEIVEAVCEFTRSGLEQGDRVLLVATEAHSAAFRSRLGLTESEFGELARSKRLTFVDAQQLLGSFMQGALPNPEQFHRTVGELLVELSGDPPSGLRVYGEMVDLLSADGNTAAALLLEDLWNELQKSHTFTLFCGYELAHFRHAPLELLEVCERHSHLSGHEARQPDPKQSGVFPGLQAADPLPLLATEIARKKAVEWALRRSIADLQASEDRLRNSARQLEVVTDALPVLVSYVDRSHHYRFVNQTYETWFGRPRSDFVGAHVRDVVGEAAYSELESQIETALAGKCSAFQGLVHYTDGKPRHVEATYIPHVTSDGSIPGFVALIADVSERRKLEDARELSAKRAERLVRITGAIADAVTSDQVVEAVVNQVAAALEASSAALWLLTEERVASLVRAVGYSEAATRAFQRADLDMPKSFPALDCIRLGAPVWLGSQTDLVARYPHLAGQVTKGKSYRISCLPIVVHGVTLGAVAFTFEQGPPLDVDERRFLQLIARYTAQALERLRLVEVERQMRTTAETARLRAELLYSLAESVITAESLDTVLDAALDALGKALGTDRSAILTFDKAGVMRFRAFRGLSPEYRAAVEGHSPWKSDERAPAPILVSDVDKEPTLAAFGDLFRREGIGALGFIPLVAGNKLLGKFMVYYAKPHELSAAELDLARAIANHAAAAAARFSTLEDLQQTVRFNELFTGVLGHDLRNPLGAILTAAQVAANRDSEQRMAKPLARIKNSGARMARMIDQLLDFTRVRVGSGVPLNPGATDLSQVVRQVVEELETGKPEARISVEFAGEDWRGVWDADRLAQVFSNLVANALQHGDAAHGVRVALHARSENAVRVDVTNGGAISSSLIDSIFEPMTGGTRRHDNSQGLGLGLFISREIVSAHGGRIWVASDPANGTTFSVELPRCTATS